MSVDTTDVEVLLNNLGYQTVSGADDVLALIESMRAGPDVMRCSGFGVFPDGLECLGCPDCKSKRADREAMR